MNASRKLRWIEYKRQRDIAFHCVPPYSIIAVAPEPPSLWSRLFCRQRRTMRKGLEEYT